jgi:stage II sporulation protein D
MRWNLRLHKSNFRGRQALLVAGVAVLGVAACVSLSSPRGSTGNLPVAMGGYKNGRNQTVRILLSAGGTSRIGGTGDWAIYQDGSDRPIAQHSRGDSIALPLVGSAEQQCSSVSSACTDIVSTLPSGATPLVARASHDAVIIWNGKRYRGELLLSRGDSGVVVINRLSMDDYLRGVVPLEIGNRTSAEAAAVEAQAVAARTYAYKHLNNSRAFDMYATVQDQVYGGVEAEKPLSDSAINSTADVVVL